MQGQERFPYLRALAGLFLRLGIIGFGGPAVHIAMMEEEVVERRQWLTRERFLDLVGATNLIPGPNSTEMAIHIGYIQAGWPGLVVAGICFILPAVFITAVCAWAYMQFGSLPQVAPFLFGIKPAVLAVILAAVWRLGRTALKGKQALSLFTIGFVVALASFLGINEILALLGGGIIGMFWLCLPEHWKLLRKKGLAVLAFIVGRGLWYVPTAKAAGKVATAVMGSTMESSLSVSLWQLGLFFLKIGSVLYGSGYVLVAFLEGGLVHDYGWLTQQQLLDAIAIGQFTPGPVLSTATFIGYLISGTAGAVIATVAIFFPSFLFVAALNPIVPRLRRTRWSARFLDAVNISAVALMAVVTIKLAQVTLITWPAWLIALSAAVLGIYYRVNATWLILGGAVGGWMLGMWGG
jgi:chromate transporter